MMKKLLTGRKRSVAGSTAVPRKRCGGGATDWKTKIVCTLGPATNTEAILQEMVDSGMDVVRMNFSHGSESEKRELFSLVRKVGAANDEQLAILCDIQGPKIRTGKIAEPFHVAPGSTIRVIPDNPGFVGNSEIISIQYATMLKDLVVHDLIFINDGIVRLKVTENTKTELICVVESGGMISTHKGCNIPSGNISLDVVTEKDKVDLKIIADLNPEYLAASFVGTADDIRKVRAELKKHGNTEIKIIAKVERPIALQNIDSIIEASDGIMVARGDLGVEIPAYDVPSAQKMIIRKCNKAGRPVIVATQMLESMIENARPTRAEASDVFNAVLDGADAVMLSGETSVGAHPVDAVKYMDQIVGAAEKHLEVFEDESGENVNAIAETMGHSIQTLAESFVSKGFSGKIISVSRSGTTTQLVSKFRPPLPIVTISPSLRTTRELALMWGVHAIHDPTVKYEECDNIEWRWACAIKDAVDRCLLDVDKDHAICVSGTGITTGVDFGVDPCHIGVVCGTYRVSHMIALHGKFLARGSKEAV